LDANAGDSNNIVCRGARTIHNERRWCGRDGNVALEMIAWWLLMNSAISYQPLAVSSQFSVTAIMKAFGMAPLLDDFL
jgi:hypothetical protein